LSDTFDVFPAIAGSDSHVIDDIGLFFMEDINEEINDFSSLKNFFGKNKQ